jgi:uncharacterized repeat protein (TIGR01451 family)
MIMNKHNAARVRWHTLGLSLVAAAAGAAQPASPGGACVSLQTQALQEQSVVGADGTRRVTLVPATTVVPGDQVVWQTTARNSCASAAANVVINQAVPEHMTLMANSAAGSESRIVFSLDGKSFLPLAEIVVAEADGTRRPARAEDVRHVRWVLSGSIGANESVSVRYSARLR